MYKKVAFVIMMMLLTVGLPAQRKAIEARDTSRWEYHLSTGTTVCSGWGKTDALMWVAPRVSYHASDKLTLKGGFAAVGSLLGGHQVQGYQVNLAPRRSGTRLIGGFVSASYRVNSRLDVWASVQRVTGWHEPLWAARGEARPVDISSFSGGFSYALSDHSLFEMHFHFVHDHYGNSALGLLGHPYYGPGVSSWELYNGPWFY